jgi:hypothetical protein
VENQFPEAHGCTAKSTGRFAVAQACVSSRAGGFHGSGFEAGLRGGDAAEEKKYRTAAEHTI